MLLVATAGVFGIIGQIQMIVATFRTGILWGLAYLFLPITGLFYLCFHWNEGKRALTTMLTGAAIFLLAFATALCIQHFLDHA